MKLLKKRKKSSKHFKLFCKIGLYLNLAFLVVFLGSIAYMGFPAFNQTYIYMTPSSDSKITSLLSRSEQRKIRLQGGVKENAWFLANSEVDQYVKQKFSRLKDSQRALIDALKQEKRIETRLNLNFFFNGDSKTSPEQSGVLAGAIGTLLVILVCMVVAIPISIATAIYLEEFAPQNWLTRIIEVCINNLAGIPSIIFGLLGLGLFINFFGMPRSSALVGGLTLAIMSLPIIIVASQSALKSVDIHLKKAGYALGMSKWQVIKGISLPMAIPTILTGSILALAQAIGETAPLMLIGMIAFIPDVSTSLTQPTTVLPALIYNWASMPEKAFLERAAAGILVLLGLLVLLNLIAIYLRKYFQGKQSW